MTITYLIAWAMDNIVLSVFMVLIALSFVFSTLSINRQYRKARKTILALNKSIDTKKDGVTNKKSFFEAVENSSIAHLKGSFDGFLTGFTSGNRVTFDLEGKKFFNLQTIKNESISDDVVIYSKGLSISLGVLGTFLGLVIGINGAAAGMASTDANLARMALEDLLSGAGIAFVTSLAGLLVGMLLTRQVARREAKLAKTWASFEKTFLISFNYYSVRNTLNSVRSSVDDMEAETAKQTTQLTNAINESAMITAQQTTRLEAALKLMSDKLDEQKNEQ